MNLSNHVVVIFFATIFTFRVVNGQLSIGATIQNNPDTSRFAQALQDTDRMSLLEGNDDVYTVFAPINSAIEADRTFQVYMADPQSWHRHLQDNVDLHIAPGVSLTLDELFNSPDNITQLDALARRRQYINVTQSFNLVQGQEVITGSVVECSNGVLYLVEGVLPNHFRLYNFYSGIFEQSELNPQINDVVEMAGFQDPLVELREYGSTWIAPRNRAFALGTDPIITAEFTDPNTLDRTYDSLMYNLLDFNIYREDFPRDSYLLVLPRYHGAHLIITRDRDGDNFRFNDARVMRPYLANNGPVYIVDRILTPPGLIQMIGFIAAYTSVDIKETNQFMISTLWDLRNFSNSVGGGLNTGGYNYTAITNPDSPDSYRNFTMFVPMSYAYNIENRDDIVRVSTPMWIRHLQNFMGHWLIQPAMTQDEIYAYAQSQGGNVQLQMVSGFNTTLLINENDQVEIDGATFVEPNFNNMRGNEGYANFISAIPLPPSIEFSIYEQIQQNWELSFLETLMDTILMGVYIDNLRPLTFFAAPNHYWDVELSTNEIEYVIRNHAFRGLLFTDVLRSDEYNGHHIQSVEGHNWTVNVINDTIYIDYNNTYTNATIIEGEHYSNILCRTGVMHFVDHLFLKREYRPFVPTPTFAPIAQFGGELDTMPPGYLPMAPTPAPVGGGGGGGGGGGDDSGANNNYFMMGLFFLYTTIVASVSIYFMQ